MKKDKELTEQRALDNLLILTKLATYIANNPDLRFGQALFNLNIVIGFNADQHDPHYVWKDEFYLEPGEILKRMKE